MPYKSEAQRRKFHELLAQGKISKSVVEEFEKASKGMKLPDRLTPKKPQTGLERMKARIKSKGY